VRIAITKAYKYLYYPAADAPKANVFLLRETLPAQDQGDVEKDQTNVVLRVLRALKKTLTADDDTLSAIYAKSKAWDQNQVTMSTDDLRKAFARKPGLRILLDVGQLKKTIKNGVETKVWIYYDANEQFGYDHESPPPAWQIGDDTILYLPDAAAKLQVRIKGKWQPKPDGGGGSTPIEDVCPVCKMPADHCVCGIGGGGKQAPAKLQGQGAVNQAFQQVLDLCQEHKIERLKLLSIKIEAANKQAAGDLRALGLAIPQFGKGRFTVTQDVLASYGAGATVESFRSDFRGGWERYKRLKQIVDAFAQEADELKATMRVNAEFEGGLPVAGEQFAAMRDVLVALEVGKVLVEAVPE
jgi:hypothetical protein